MSDSTAPGSEERPGPAPVPPAPPAPPVPPAPPAPPATPASGYQAPASAPAPGYGAPRTDAPSYGTPTPPGTAPAYASAPPAPAPPRTLSLTGMILGIAGLVITIFAWGFGFLLSAPAVVLGFLGRRREPGARGFALTAIITGFAGIVISLIYLAITVVIFVVAIQSANY
ncbi:DUF4190 domain-containing protein [Rathayibacter sp. Leaf299]|uniref:DUF4190 domain-containing protein n=2 Tax=unclassified Rathayibacter TaxID=2609250 RepID=UPI0012F9633C|nr:DUF4190 domain-containing protein [Rathayibacter sp. Leaf299]